MKKYIIMLLAIFNVCLAFAACSSDEAANESGTMTESGNETSGKTLVVYYSYTGNTESVVNTLLQQIEADVLEVEPTEENVAYEANNYAIGSELIQAIRNNPDDAASYPSIKTTFDNWDEYSTVIIATPLWWSNMAAPMQSFLFKYGAEMAGKKAGLIVSSHTSGISGVVSDAKRLVPDAEWYSESLHITASNLSSAASLTSTWLESIGYNSSATTQTVNKISIEVNGYTFTATLEDNSSAAALVELLKEGSITIEAREYGGFEKVGALPQSLPQNDTDITTSAGDIVLYLGTSICFYYAENTWDFTLLGSIDNAEAYDLESIYGSGNATFVLRLLDESAVSSVAADSQVVKTESFSLNGAKAQGRGIVIERKTLADGTAITRKVIRE